MLGSVQPTSTSIEIYKGTLGLLLQQCVNVYNEGADLNIQLDILEMLKERLRVSDDVSTRGGVQAVVCETHDSVISHGIRRVQTKIEQPQARGKWTKNRNLEYMKQKKQKNTEKKIKKERAMQEEDTLSWQAGGPRTTLLLRSIGAANLVQVGMLWNTRDHAELAITEHAELCGRHITFIRYGNRLRAMCLKLNDDGTKCHFTVNVRFGEQTIVGENGSMFGWYVTQRTNHTCRFFRKGRKTMYSVGLLARSVLTRVLGLEVPTTKQCTTMVNDLTLRPINIKQVYKVRNEVEQMLLGRADCRVQYVKDIGARLIADGHYFQYGTISADAMRRMKRDVLCHRHTLKYKHAIVKVPFDDSTVDYSMIMDNRVYLSWIFFASRSAMAQASMMKEPNSEADFCFSHAVNQGVIGLELTCDADRKVVPRAFMWSAEDESTKIWKIFLENLTAAYPSHDNPDCILKVDGAKGAWAAISTVTKRIGFRNHRHRGNSAQLKFGVKGKEAYLKIAKSRDGAKRDAMIKKQSLAFQKWLALVPLQHWSAAEQSLVHGQYETSCVEGLNALIKHNIDIRGIDPVSGLKRWISWDSDYYERRRTMALKAIGSVTPRMQLILQRQRLILHHYQVTKVTVDKRKATVTDMTPKDDSLYCTTFTTAILQHKNSNTGMMVTCSCKRDYQGILCDHVAAHVQHVGLWQLEDLVHERDTMVYYKAQYPPELPPYPLTCYNDLTADDTLFMPVITSVRRGRPKKTRIISQRETAVAKARRTHKRKSKIVEKKQLEPKRAKLV